MERLLLALIAPAPARLRVVGNWYAMTGYGIAYPKQSKFKDMINKEIIEMHHSGECTRFVFVFFLLNKYPMDVSSRRNRASSTILVYG